MYTLDLGKGRTGIVLQTAEESRFVLSSLEAKTLPQAPVVFDVETKSLKPEWNGVFFYQVLIERPGKVPYIFGGYHILETFLTIQLYRMFISRASVIVAHNLKFDMGF